MHGGPVRALTHAQNEAPGAHSAQVFAAVRWGRALQPAAQGWTVRSVAAANSLQETLPLHSADGLFVSTWCRLFVEPAKWTEPHALTLSPSLTPLRFALQGRHESPAAGASGTSGHMLTIGAPPTLVRVFSQSASLALCWRTEKISINYNENVSPPLPSVLGRRLFLLAATL